MRQGPGSVNWGTLVKSDITGTQYIVSLRGVNMDTQFVMEDPVDFRHLFDGVYVANIVNNTRDIIEEPTWTVPIFQTRISYDDGKWFVYCFPKSSNFCIIGGSWQSISPPVVDSLGNEYDCKIAVSAYCNFECPC